MHGPNSHSDPTEETPPDFNPLTGEIMDLVIVENDGTETVLPPGPDVTGKI